MQPIEFPAEVPPRPAMPPNQQLIDSLTSHISLYFSNLTALDPGFVRILLQMLADLNARGPGTFIILPDLPSPGNLLGLCYRHSHGLLSRVAESDDPDRRIFESARLFNSKEGDDVKECSISVNCLEQRSNRAWMESLHDQ